MRPLAGLSVCYVSTEEFSFVTRTYKQAMTLAEAGARVTFVGWDDYMPAKLAESPFEVISVPVGERPRTRSSSASLYPVRVLVNRTVNWLVNAQLNPRREMRLITGLHPQFLEAIRSTRANVVQAVDLTALECSHAAARKMGARLVYDSHEFWAGFLQNPATTLRSEISQRLLTTERQLIAQCDLVLTVSEPMADRLAERYAVRPPTVLFNSPPTRVDIAQAVHQPVRLVFHGSFSADRNLDGLIRAMQVLKPTATLDIHGTSLTIGSDALERLVDELGLQGAVRIHGPFEYNGVVDLIRDYDVGVMAARVIEDNFDVTLPNKIFDCMCAGLAVAMNDSTAFRRLLQEVAFGITIDSSSPETIARDLEPLLRDPARILRMKQAAVAMSERYWWPEQGRRLVEAYSAMLGPVGSKAPEGSTL